MNNPELILTPRRCALLAGHDNVLDVLVRVQAPETVLAEASRRPPLHVALVIDRSGSMAGQPLEEAKRCAVHVIDGLQPNDKVSLVAYDYSVETLSPAIPAGERGRLHTALARICEGGSTNLHGGWLRGAETLAPLASPATLSRVILLSDGCANQGLQDTGAIADQCRELAETGVTTSTYGLGHHFNEALMVAMAKAGGGNSYYGRTAEDLMEPFQDEFALMNAVCARRVRLRLEPWAGVEVSVMNGYAHGDDGWQLPDLVAGGETWAMVRLKIPASVVASATDGALSLLHASLRYTDLAGEPRAVQPVALALEAMPSAAYQAIAEDSLVARRQSEIEAAAIQKDARKAVMHGDWKAAERLLDRLEVFAKDHEWLAGILAELRQLAGRRDQAMFQREAHYSAERLSTRVAACMESANLANDLLEVPSFMRRKRVQGKSGTAGPEKS